VSPGSSLARRERAQDLALIARTPRLKPDAVGELLGAGMQHRIYEYDDNGTPMVLKISTSVPGLRFPSAADAEKDVALVARYFEPYFVEPTEVVRLNDLAYAVKQRRLVNLRSIAPDDLRQENIKRQFLDIVGRNQKMLKEAGRSLDYLGREGQRKARAALLGLRVTPTISNLVVEDAPDGSARLRVVDTDLENFHPGATSLRDKQSALAARMAVGINRWLIR